jgi:hypothetical protein
MKKRLLWLAAVFLVLSIVIAGSSAVALVALGKSDGQAENPLAGRVLQRSDLPQDSEAYYAEQLTADRFPGAPFPGNIPLQVEGFLDAYAVDALYPLTLQDRVLQGKLQRKESVAFVLNVIYRYRDDVQAATALRRQLEWFLEEGSLAVDAKAERAGFDQSLAAANGVQGSAMQVTYSQEGLTWVSHWFFGVESDTLMLLWVDGLPDPGTHEVFDSLVATIVQR